MSFVVTSGTGHIDIDALACVEAYNDFLLHRGEASEAVLTPPLNASVPPMLRALPMRRVVGDSWNCGGRDIRFVVMDVSDPSSFDPVVTLDAVTAVFDHHHGFEDYWRARAGVESVIEPIGACATLVWEVIDRDGAADSVSAASGQFLLAAIVSNSLNFRAAISTERDRVAYDDIAGLLGVDDNWKRRYFEEVSASILENPTASLLLDCKTADVGGGQCWIGQAEIWDAAPLTGEAFVTDLRQKVFREVGCGFANIISISEGVNYIHADSTEVLDFLETILPGQRVQPLMLKTDRLWLRKEILKAAAM